jgi:transcriptional repressor NrdR
VEAVPLYVVKKDGRREEFNRQKLIGGLILASKKRDVSPDDLGRLVDDVENDLRSRNLSEVGASEIGTLVMEKLRVLDEIAYVRFASVYRSFKDVEQMRSTIEDVLANAPGMRGTGRRRRRTKAGDGSELAFDLDK